MSQISEKILHLIGDELTNNFFRIGRKTATYETDDLSLATSIKDYYGQKDYDADLTTIGPEVGKKYKLQISEPEIRRISIHDKRLVTRCPVCTEGRFFTYKPYRIDDNDGDPVAVYQCEFRHRYTVDLGLSNHP